MRFLPEHIQPATQLLAEVLREPAFPEKECQTAKHQALQELKHLDDEPLAKAFVVLKELFFGAEWGHSELGSDSSVPEISRADIHEFWKAHFIPAGSLVAAAGHFDPDLLIKQVENLFGNTG